MKIVFYEVQDWEAEYLKNKLMGHDLEFFAAPFSEKNPPLQDADIVSMFTRSRITAPMLDDLPNLKFATTRTTGFDHVDLEACRARGVVVSNVPTYGENTVAEFTFALILTISRKMYPAVQRIKEQGWFSWEGLRGFDLADKTLGVIGTGHIGAYVIKIAHGFGMKVVAYDPYPNQELAKQYSFAYETLESLLTQSDIITLHAPYTPATHHLLNTQNLKMVKPGSILINTSRGGLVETEALVAALQSGVLAGAGLDVLEEEGFVQEEVALLNTGHPSESQLKTALADHALMQMENVIITPHNAFHTTEAMRRILDTTVGNIEGFIGGKTLNVVNG